MNLRVKLLLRAANRMRGDARPDEAPRRSERGCIASLQSQRNYPITSATRPIALRSIKSRIAFA